MNSFKVKACFFEDSHGGLVVPEYAGLYPDDICRVEDMSGQSLHTFGDDASVPVFFGKPVANIGRFAENISVEDHTNASDHFFVYGYCKQPVGVVVDGSADPVFSMRQRVWVWEPVSQVSGDVEIIGMCSYPNLLPEQSS